MPEVARDREITIIEEVRSIESHMHVLFCYLYVEQYLEPMPMPLIRLKTQSPGSKSECNVPRRPHTLNLIRKELEIRGANKLLRR